MGEIHTLQNIRRISHTSAHVRAQPSPHADIHGSNTLSIYISHTGVLFQSARNIARSGALQTTEEGLVHLTN